MALPIMTYIPQQRGYSFVDNEDDAFAAQLDGGGVLYRQGQEGNPIQLPLSWVLKSSEIDGFFTFYKTTLDNGALPFEIDLQIDEYDQTTHKAYFVPDSLKISRLTNGVVYVSAMIEAQPADYDITDGLDIVGLYNEFGRNWRTLFPPLEDQLDEIVNVDWPTVL